MSMKAFGDISSITSSSLTLACSTKRDQTEKNTANRPVSLEAIRASPIIRRNDECTWSSVIASIRAAIFSFPTSVAPKATRKYSLATPAIEGGIPASSRAIFPKSSSLRTLIVCSSRAVVSLMAAGERRGGSCTTDWLDLLDLHRVEGKLFLTFSRSPKQLYSMRTISVVLPVPGGIG